MFTDLPYGLYLEMGWTNPYSGNHWRYPWLMPAMMEARESWMSLQAGKDEMRHWFGDSSDELKRQPLSTLLKYPQTVSKRESKLQKGALVE